MADSTTSSILDCIKVGGVPIVTWINNLIADLQKQINAIGCRCFADGSTITGSGTSTDPFKAVLSTHPALAVTQTQDVAGVPGARISFNASTQALNLPPPIYAIMSVGDSGMTALDGIITPITDMVLATETVTGMVTSGKIVIPKAGRYIIQGAWGANIDEPNTTDGYSIAASFIVNGVATGRYTASFITGVSEQANAMQLGYKFNSGDTLTLGCVTDYPGGAPVLSAYCSALYIEGT